MLPGAREFFRAGYIYSQLNEDHFTSTMAAYIESGAAFVVCRVVNGFLEGALGAAIAKDFATGELTCSELFFHITESKRGFLGIKLMAEFEKEAKRRGARRIFMMHMLGEGACNARPLYERRKFVLKENVFCKELHENPRPAG